MSTPPVRARKTSLITLPAGGPLPPPGPTVPLSPFDAYWIPLPPVRRVFLYPPPPPSLPFAAVAETLQSSLAAILPSFHPFAGTVTYSSSSDALAIVCSDDAGVMFVEAETDLDFERLVSDEMHDAEAFRQLAPDIMRGELPAPVMAVQVTEFVAGGGGVAVGIALHHAAADGRGLWRFLETWAAASRTRSGLPGPPPVHDRSLVRFDGSEELTRLFLRQLAPDLPKTVPPQHVFHEGPPLSRRTFKFDSSAVLHLKQQLVPGNAGQAPSTFATLAAHGWASIARARGLDDDGPVFAVFLADCRAQLCPRAIDTYIGNCLAVCCVKMSGSKLTGPGGLARAFLAVRDAITAVKEEPLSARERWVTDFEAMPPGREAVFAGSPRFAAYEMDFGWGRPARTELPSMNHDGEMVLVAGREAGSVQVSVAIAADKMEAFAEKFAVNFGQSKGHA